MNHPEAFLSMLGMKSELFRVTEGKEEDYRCRLNAPSGKSTLSSESRNPSI